MSVDQITPLVALVITVVVVIVGLIIALIRVRVGGSANLEDKVAEARLEAQRILARAEEEARVRSEEKRAVEEEALVRQRESTDARQRRILQREERLDQQATNLEERERLLIEREVEAKRLRREAREVEAQAWNDLTRLAGLDRTEARRQIMEKVEHQARRDAMMLIRDIEIRSREEAEWRSRRILAGVVQRMSHQVVKDATSTMIDLPNDQMKGRIIGREGRNIRAFEAATGVSLIIDDKLAEAVVLNSYDPIRREVARLALEKLIMDGRLNPTAIEEAVSKADSEVSHSIRDAGEGALLEVNLSKMRPELIELLGQLRYRTSYGQNVLDHLVESAHAAALLASELGVDPAPVKRAALLHDIGKAVSHKLEGSHAHVGAEMARRLGEDPGGGARHRGSSQRGGPPHRPGGAGAGRGRPVGGPTGGSSRVFRAVHAEVGEPGEDRRLLPGSREGLRLPGGPGGAGAGRPAAGGRPDRRGPGQADRPPGGEGDAVSGPDRGDGDPREPLH